MEATVWITISRAGAVKMTKEKPALDRKQRAVLLSISVSDSVFEEPPILDAELTIPADHLAWPAPVEPLAVEIWSEP
jgi:hypothetical protein